MFPEIAFVCPFRSREDEPVGHGFHFVPCRAFYFSFNPPKKIKKKSQEFAIGPPLCLQHQALLLNTATHLLFILMPKGFGGPTCFTDCCGSLIFSIKSKGRAAGRKRRRGGVMKFSISAETLVDIVGLSCGFWAGVSVGFCSSPCDLLCAISQQHRKWYRFFPPFFSPSPPPPNTAGVWLPGGLNLPPYMVVVSSVLPNGL